MNITEIMAYIEDNDIDILIGAFSLIAMLWFVDINKSRTVAKMLVCFVIIIFVVKKMADSTASYVTMFVMAFMLTAIFEGKKLKI